METRRAEEKKLVVVSRIILGAFQCRIRRRFTRGIVNELKCSVDVEEDYT